MRNKMGVHRLIKNGNENVLVGGEHFEKGRDGGHVGEVRLHSV